jgi:hypothetical protein
MKDWILWIILGTPHGIDALSTEPMTEEECTEKALQCFRNLEKEFPNLKGCLCFKEHPDADFARLPSR